MKEIKFTGVRLELFDLFLRMLKNEWYLSLGNYTFALAENRLLVMLWNGNMVLGQLEFDIVPVGKENVVAKVLVLKKKVSYGRFNIEDMIKTIEEFALDNLTKNF